MRKISTLIYFHDPMCSWCWAFNPVWQEITAELPNHVASKRILGGLAPDTEQAMPLAMQSKIQGIWRSIQETVPGTQFNFDFWKKCTPRRSTYSACRSVIAARLQNPNCEEKMILAIQQAYYLAAKNPSEQTTLIALAEELGLDGKSFSADMNSTATHEALLKDIELTRKLGVTGFPTLLLEKNKQHTLIRHDYHDPEIMLKQIRRLG